ncbi:TetR/AcrR family transcriptional regulator [Fulvivirga sp. M361]|uniref:TetR/AcrR family transcriptional regulator n=1 Tax=Fulvivirga sp. M361 TaxID=2594266 RepID=UPI00117B5884|nr:TetR/AcrR family transcriptional regulator [Fulvivirga sp. M361]TRX54323.1 TetR/AcrR family transcriptional regulator [Fulvivirga sp. M361]
MKEENKNRALEIGVKILSQKGYHNLGLREVLEEASIPSGSFYYYFKSKVDFVLKAIEYYTDYVIEFYKSQLLEGDISYKKRLESLFEAETKWLLSEDCRIGCMLGDLSSELAGQVDAAQRIQKSSYEKFQGIVERFLREGQDNGSFSMKIEPKEMAMFFLSSRQGALTMVKAIRSIEPYEVFKSKMMDQIMK